MVDNNTVMKSGRCLECGSKETDGFSCYELFGFPLVWEHNDPHLYELHFWLVSCYMIQHPSNYTKEGYKHLVKLFIDAYDNKWDTPYILKKNREIVKSVGKITNPIPSKERKRKLRLWSMTIEDIYLGGEKNAIVNINKWKEQMRNELSC
ncbi:DUF5946 family protein [Geosporobacter ferrireducens]|uniref:Uncharacterized protein n=1 Tax=Geosporobacter ferrireducens TaxID=1424294 RepID=A0A1D8GF09_9FIRM|nr:DUF5946 family protein [Geosporobacter ferrireducens]AOT69478.1 hypothetical protein Gferi_07780 [Geosporobacter ferrireducens]